MAKKFSELRAAMPPAARQLKLDEVSTMYLHLETPHGNSDPQMG